MKPLESILPKTVRERIIVGFVTALLMIALGFALTLYSYSRYSDDSRRVEHSHEVTNRLNLIQLSLVDLETGVRGFIASKDELFLEMYKVVQSRIPEDIRQVRHMVANDSVQQAFVDSLAQLAKEKIDISARQIRAVHENSPSTIIKSYMFLAKVRMDRVRDLINLMNKHERKLLNLRGKDAAVSFRNTLIIIFLLSLLTFIALIISYNVLENELNVRQQTENQLRAYEEDLKGKIQLLENSNEELERFAFVASHDMQEPLRKIQSFGYLLRDRHGATLQAEGTLYLSKILQSAERMSKMIKDLLNFSRISNKKESFGTVQLTSIVHGILNDQELKINAAGARIDIDNLPIIEAVSSQMDHLFSNLISNALKFIKPDEAPVIKLDSELVDGSEFEGLVEGKRYYRITVEDNGIGFDEKYVDHIFKIFQRLHGKSTYDGTGIGLAICKRIVSYHNGIITARSQSGRGTTFIVVLPETQFHPGKNV